MLATIKTKIKIMKVKALPCSPKKIKASRITGLVAENPRGAAEKKNNSKFKLSKYSRQRKTTRSDNFHLSQITCLTQFCLTQIISLTII